MRVSALLALLPLVAAAPAVQKRAPLIPATKGEAVEGKFIVKLKPASSSNMRIAVNSAVQSIAADADQVFDNLGGFAATLTAEEVEALRDNPSVEYIEQDAIYRIQATQSNAPWGLARLSNTQRGSRTYTYADSAGTGACAYVVDTGVDTTHPDLEGRATFLRNFAGASTGDPQGHGSHVAGTIAGKTYGVAKKARVFGVTVLDANGEGTTSGILSGMDFVVTDSKNRKSTCPRGIVVNMSLGGGFSQSLNNAAANIVRSGLFLAVAAGNGDRLGRPLNINQASPASEPTACTVGATDVNDRVASFSNYGNLLDIYAPGVDVLSIAPGGRTATLSGTSMASPHIAGLAAYYLGTGAATASNMCNYIRSQALSGVITGVPSGTANLLAQN
ncbi:Cuticle-degrading protease [Paramyrothecium foliicola]|nr:Cuticle-degrading protease [Paramyrothecium foliicola]